mgnify:CR=1 FL=1
MHWSFHRTIPPNTDMRQSIKRDPGEISEYNMEDKVLMYPGADEVELTLLARMLNVLAGRQAESVCEVYIRDGKEYYSVI